MAAVVQVLMAVEEVFGRVCVKHFHKTFEAGMGKVIAIAESIGRSMSQQDVEAFMSFYRPAQLADPLFHLIFGVLELTIVIVHTAAQTYHPNAFVDQEPVVC